MRRIIIPNDAKDVPIEVGQGDEKKTGIVPVVPFAEFVSQTLLNAPTWSTQGEGPAGRTETLRLSFEVQEKFERPLEPGAHVDISDGAWERLCESLDPALVRGTRCARALMAAGFWSAIEDAEYVDEDEDDEAEPAPASRSSKKTGGKGRGRK